MVSTGRISVVCNADVIAVFIPRTGCRSGHGIVLIRRPDQRRYVIHTHIVSGHAGDGKASAGDVRCFQIGHRRRLVILRLRRVDRDIPRAEPFVLPGAKVYRINRDLVAANGICGDPEGKAVVLAHAAISGIYIRAVGVGCSLKEELVIQIDPDGELPGTVVVIKGPACHCDTALTAVDLIHGALRLFAGGRDLADGRADLYKDQVAEVALIFGDVPADVAGAAPVAVGKGDSAAGDIRDKDRMLTAVGGDKTDDVARFQAVQRRHIVQLLPALRVAPGVQVAQLLGITPAAKVVAGSKGRVVAGVPAVTAVPVVTAGHTGSAHGVIVLFAWVVRMVPVAPVGELIPQIRNGIGIFFFQALTGPHRALRQCGGRILLRKGRARQHRTQQPCTQDHCKPVPEDLLFEHLQCLLSPAARSGAALRQWPKWPQRPAPQGPARCGTHQRT